jgi:hypothetical protein
VHSGPGRIRYDEDVLSARAVEQERAGGRAPAMNWPT